MKWIFVLLLSLAALTASAQVTGPKKSATPIAKRDTLIKPRAIVLPQGRQLPPSLRAELAQKQVRTGRAIVFRDTISASLRQKQHFNDSTFTDSLVFTDSALSLVDSAVSLTHKEWLDSQVVELPEIARFGDKVHFNYPIRIQAEAFRKDVPFDTSVLARMNPVTLENLPFFDETPIPMPLSRGRNWNAFLELGAGNLYLPKFSGRLTSSLNDRSELSANADYLNRGSSNPVRQFWSLGSQLRLALGEDPAMDQHSAAEFRGELSTDGKVVNHAMDVDRDEIHTLSNSSLSATLNGSVVNDLTYQLNGGLNWFNDSYAPIFSESGQTIQGTVCNIWTRSKVQMMAEARYERIGSEGGVPKQSDSLITLLIGGSSHELSELRVMMGRTGDIDWFVGFALHPGIGSLQPQAKFRWTLNPRWELGGSFEPRSQLIGHKKLTEKNPFFSPILTRSIIDPGMSADRPIYDPRGVVREIINLRGHMNYYLSPYDEMGVGLQLLEREDEPIFRQADIDWSDAVFNATVENTRRLILDAHAHLLVFTKDVASLAFEYHSATITSTNTAIPFEPTFSATASYTVNSIDDRFTPTLEFVQLSRKDRALSFLNLRAAWKAAPKFTILLAGENLLNGPGDYWTGYNETPRSVTASVRYTF